jgi:hypothetical protein
MYTFARQMFRAYNQLLNTNLSPTVIIGRVCCGLEAQGEEKHGLSREDDEAYSELRKRS